MKENRTQTSYLFWLACIFQIHGLHRLYNGKIGTGLLWMCTFGFLGVGQFIDLFLVPGMVDEHNMKLRAKLGISASGMPLQDYAVNPTLVREKELELTKKTQAPTEKELMVKLAQAAQRRGGKLSVTQAVIETGIEFAEIESTLQTMVKKGYVGIDNHPVSGVVIYDFLEL